MNYRDTVVSVRVVEMGDRIGMRAVIERVPDNLRLEETAMVPYGEDARALKLADAIVVARGYIKHVPRK